MLKLVFYSKNEINVSRIYVFMLFLMVSSRLV